MTHSYCDPELHNGEHVEADYYVMGAEYVHARSMVAGVELTIPTTDTRRTESHRHGYFESFACCAMHLPHAVETVLRHPDVRVVNVRSEVAR